MDSSTDHLVLARWRVLSTCEHVISGPSPDVERVCLQALATFATEGPCAATDAALSAVGAALRLTQSTAVMPAISAGLRQQVETQLASLAGDPPQAISDASSALPSIQRRLADLQQSMPVPGLRHRVDLAARIVADAKRSEEERALVAAALIYVHNFDDVVPDEFGPIGLLDDDYALRVALEAAGVGNQELEHWSERVAGLWNELPFLRGVNLVRGDQPIPVTWLDRLNSLVSFEHVSDGARAPLMLLQPTVAVSPLHALVSLIGYLVLDALTSSTRDASSLLKLGQRYELDGFVVEFGGVDRPPSPTAGRLWLKFKGGARIAALPSVLSRMVATERPLTSAKGFPSSRDAPMDPMQKFFNWDAAIGSANVQRKLVLVTSQARALELLEGVESNGVKLLDHGLVQFIGSIAGERALDAHSALLIVVPSLAVAVELMHSGQRAHAIIVDGYERLHRGREELPRLKGKDAPTVIVWSASGYYPAIPPAWLPQHTLLQVSPDDLAKILQLDEGGGPESARALLEEAATGASVSAELVKTPQDEHVVSETVRVLQSRIRGATSIPSYASFQLASLARVVRLLSSATPCAWAEVVRVTEMFSALTHDLKSALKGDAARELEEIRAAEADLRKALKQVRSDMTSKGVALARFLQAAVSPAERWLFACEHPEQARAVGHLLRVKKLQGVDPALVRDIAVCSRCLVAGWTSSNFARRVVAHTPSSLVALVDEIERDKWEAATSKQIIAGSRSMLSHAAGDEAAPGHSMDSVLADNGDDDSIVGQHDDREEVTPCVFIWLVGESRAKVTTRDADVYVDSGTEVVSRKASLLSPDEHVLLGMSATRWSPSDELTEAVINSIDQSQPELVRDARRWRSALRDYQRDQRISVPDLCRRLETVGVKRVAETVGGWLEVERADPIAPHDPAREIPAIFRLIGQEDASERVLVAAKRVYSLRAAAGRALLQLWKGETRDLGIDEALLAGIVDRLRQEVRVFEVDTVTFGEVPPLLLGWWIPPELGARYRIQEQS